MDLLLKMLEEGELYASILRKNCLCAIEVEKDDRMRYIFNIL